MLSHECAKLVSTFCQFFAEKVNRIRDNISDDLASSARRMFAVRPHEGPELFVISASDGRRSPTVTAFNATEVVAARRTAVYAAEVMC